jgi:hypothetical protein
MRRFIWFAVPPKPDGTAISEYPYSLLAFLAFVAGDGAAGRLDAAPTP